LTYYLPK
jgi:CRP-like cAMP-binding protein